MLLAPFITGTILAGMRQKDEQMQSRPSGLRRDCQCEDPRNRWCDCKLEEGNEDTIRPDTSFRYRDSSGRQGGSPAVGSSVINSCYGAKMTLLVHWADGRGTDASGAGDFDFLTSATDRCLEPPEQHNRMEN